MKELYRWITEFPNYQVSNLGNVKNIKTQKVLQPGIDAGGYCRVTLCHDGVKYTRKVHRLVASAFLENPDNKKCVDHINNNRFDNTVINLRFATHVENGQNTIISSRNTSGVKGVCWNKRRNKWISRIMLDGISICLGYFDNIEDAKKARITKANEVFGVFKNSCEN